MLKNHHIIELDSPLRSLSWYEDLVIDIAGGHKTINAEGNIEDLARQITGFGVSYGFKFDRTLVSTCGRYVVMYVAFGTKGVLLKDFKIVREINRSYYCCEAYEFPVALMERLNDEPLLVYCPDSYDQLEIEEFSSGKRVDGELQREPADYFFGNLIFSPDFQYLLSLGWVWHPAEIAKLFKTKDLIEDIKTTDTHDDILRLNRGDEAWNEDLTGCFLSNNRMVLYRKDYDEKEGILFGFDFISIEILYQVKTTHEIGTLLPLSRDRVLNMYGKLSILEPSSGKVLFEYDKVKTSERKSILYEKENDPLWAYAADAKKLAVTYDNELHILEFE